ncbi:DUF1810 family protein [Legionella bononiensis]|uniref:DUF1810 family protein n=1 Tax=Legionella bononiensis TaxID=2793102 RepID=A0ABS1WFM4_9GAMM|nr:DUF1810 family protein [Legionella bononiensis]MBL7479199.1 DUF1810 family protein [Legionella bononiensis]MBL7528075.1 DUF1810 family protein [Legionella bononiensis]MBL7563851.1 DUF1810 family protein [Legionella bononiensis]
MSLKRFHEAQKGQPGYNQAHSEIQNGRKINHWIWYIFPQHQSLGYSSQAKLYGITDFKEACDYLRDPVLFKRYDELVKLVEKKLQTIPVETLMGGSVDARKLVSSLTLFQAAAAFLSTANHRTQNDYAVLEKRCAQIFDLISNQGYFPCESTLAVLNKPGQNIKYNNTHASVVLTPHEPSRHAKPRTSTLSHELAEYKNIRKNEWEFHYNFLGIISVLYFIQDSLFGTDHFNTKNREIKISAASKLEQILDPDQPKPEPLNAAEIKALKEGRLGDLVSRHGSLDYIITHAPMKQNDDPSSEHRLQP